MVFRDLHSCSMFSISIALSNLIEPSGNTVLFSKKLDLTLVTFNGLTSHLYASNFNPSKLFPFGEYPTEPFSKKSETLSRDLKIELESNVVESFASI